MKTTYIHSKPTTISLGQGVTKDVTKEELDSLAKSNLGKAYVLWKYISDRYDEQQAKNEAIREKYPQHSDYNPLMQIVISNRLCRKLNITESQFNYYKIVLKSKGMLIGLDDFYFWAPDWFMG